MLYILQRKIKSTYIQMKEILHIERNRNRTRNHNVFKAQSRDEIISHVGVTLFFRDENDGNQALIVRLTILNSYHLKEQ